MLLAYEFFYFRPYLNYAYNKMSTISENNPKEDYNSLTESKINSESEQGTGPELNSKPPKPEDNNSMKSPIYPHTPVKVYSDASVSKSEMLKDFKGVSIIYM